MEVLGWGPAGRRFWWLCPLPGPFGVPLHPVHERIAGVWGGIRGHAWQEELPVRPIWNWRSNEEVLSDRCAREPTAATIREWNEQWLEDTGALSGLDFEHSYGVTKDGCGDNVLVNRGTSQMRFMTWDCAPHDMVSLAENGGYAVLTIREEPDFATWVEVNAQDYLDHLASLPE